MNGKWKRFSKIEFTERTASFYSSGKAMTKLKLLGNLSMSLKEPVLPLELTGLTTITKPFLSTSPGLIMNAGQLGQSRHLNTSTIVKA